MFELFALAILVGVVLWAFYSTHPDQMPQRWKTLPVALLFFPLPIFSLIIVSLWFQGTLDTYSFWFMVGLAFGMTAIGGVLYALQQRKPGGGK